MYTIAVDVSKNKLSIFHGELGANGKFIEIENSAEQLKEFVKSNKIQLSKKTLVFFESTGIYHQTLGLFFLRKGCTVKMENALVAKRFCTSSVRKTKTDKVDAKKLFEMANLGYGSEISEKCLVNESRDLLRLSIKLTAQKAKIKTQITNAKEKKVLPKEMISLLKELIEKYEEVIEKIDEQALVESKDPEINKQVELIDSITGFSKKLAKTVVNECGDLRNFSNNNEITAYAGIDPSIKQSGKMDKKGAISKRGSSYLRVVLYYAARTAIVFDEQLKAYYEKKRSEGRSFTEVMIMISRKLLYRIRAVIKKGISYEKRTLTLS